MAELPSPTARDQVEQIITNEFLIGLGVGVLICCQTLHRLDGTNTFTIDGQVFTIDDVNNAFPAALDRRGRFLATQSGNM